MVELYPGILCGGRRTDLGHLLQRNGHTVDYDCSDLIRIDRLVEHPLHFRVIILLVFVLRIDRRGRIRCKDAVFLFFANMDHGAVTHGQRNRHIGIFNTVIIGLRGVGNPYLPVVFASMAGKVDKVIVTGGQDDSFNTSPWVQVFGYGKDPASFNADIIKNIITSYYGPAVMEIADRCRIEYDEYVEEHKTYTSEMELDPPCGKVMPGTISAHEFIMSCKKDGEEVTGFHFIHKVCHEQQPYPPMQDSYIIYGEPDLKVTIEGMIPEKESFATSTAPSVNLIPLCVEAEPGWTDALDLPASKPAM